MRAMNLAVLVLGLMLVGLALHGMRDVDTSLRVAASRPTPAPAPAPAPLRECEAPDV
jgi:hypothetical protein